MVKCLVTGGTGFVGGAVIDQLVLQGFEVTNFDICKPCQQHTSSRVRYIVGDVRDEGAILEEIRSVDWVFHLAGVLGTHELFDRARLAIDTNIVGTLNVLEAIKRYNRNTRLFIPAKPNEWNNVYSVTSAAVEKLTLSYAETYGLDTRILRLWNLYGPGQSISPVRKMVPTFFAQAIIGNPIEIFGDGDEEVRLIYIEDAAKTILSTMFSNLPKTPLEISASTKLTVSDVAKKILSVTKSNAAIENIKMRRGEQSGMYFSSLPAVEGFINNNFYTSINEGIEKSYEWYSNISFNELKIELKKISMDLK
ncbi:NAD-dependent epimerase/dehydratase family protein [Cohaesibacter gelatinilyticus]|uniref:UDP-glucose 4-epimerase n=1 Tax=Cohaesibacter gelatinilyticus TaxID=372072 RepID=A0A285PDH9_9HYPH|nr:NAD-dependent epimerase/dehydratase family protein [Cohaesibacter gelatinilyticus]SNZ19283.1 UDP-glucose 4-epimerase [Cohaesibacter gelatinilyticus]